VRSDLVALLNEFNGNIDNANIKAGANIDGAKLLAASILASKLDSAGTVTSMPATPYDGQEVNYLADATLGVVWRFKYRAASTSPYKWEFLGGTPMMAESTTDATTTSVAMAQLTPVVSLTVPLVGEYVVQFEAEVWNSIGANTISLGFSVGGAAPVPADVVAIGSPGANLVANVAWGPMRRLGWAAATVIDLRGAASANSSGFRNRKLAIRPARVG
jgi:hypothetical protein